ncbi:MATE family efflux transporter [Candidatus Binatia bacterium]|jgi:putative MATE family efflux protein|nr:MATE family efflux transporter [Candidatus Binatia bacterium]
MSERHTPEQLLAQDPLRAVARLAAPTTLVMLIAAISNVLYTYYVSRLGSDAIAAVSLVFPVSMVAMTAMAGGIGAGASSVIARSLGGRRLAAATSAAEHAFLLAVVIGIGFAIAIFFGARTVLGWMGGKGDVLDNAVVFAEVIFGGCVITFTGGMLDSVLRGEGNVRVPAIWSTTSLCLQILLTPLFMFGLGLELRGAGFATLVSQLIASVPRAWFVLGGQGAIRPRFLPRRIALEPLREILRIGIPAAVSTTVNYIGIMVLTGVVARLGTPDLAAYGLGTRLDFLLLSFAFGVSAAVLTLVGMAAGAGRPELVGRYVRAACSLIVGLLIVAGALLWWRPSLWLGIFTTDPGILAVGATYFRVIGPSYPFVGLSMVLAFAFQGLGRATPPLVVMLVRVPVVLAVALWCVHAGLGEAGVFTTIAAGNVLATGVLALLLVRELRRRGRPASAH